MAMCAHFLSLVAALAPGAAAAPQAAEALARGDELAARGRMEEAEAAYATATRLEPANGQAWNSLGHARHAQKEWADAAAAFARAKELTPREVGVLGNLGVALFENAELDRARAEFAAAVALEPEYSRGHLFLARIAAARGEDALAEREFALAVAAPRADTLAPLYQGLFFFQGRRLVEAEAAFRRAVLVAPDLHSAHMNLALVLQRLGQHDEAALHMARFRELSEVHVRAEQSRQRLVHYLRAANQEIGNGNLEVALALCLRAESEAPQAAVAHEFLARVYALLGRADDSAREAERFRALSQQESLK